MQFPIHIELRRSRLLSFLLLFFHALAVGCLLALPWPVAAHLPLLGLLVVSAVLALRPSGIVGLRLAENGGIDCIFAGAGRVAAEVRPESTVFGGLIVLRLLVGEERRAKNLTLLPDSLTAGQFRVLRVWLRWCTAASGVVRKGVDV